MKNEIIIIIIELQIAKTQQLNLTDRFWKHKRFQYQKVHETQQKICNLGEGLVKCILAIQLLYLRETVLSYILKISKIFVAILVTSCLCE